MRRKNGIGQARIGEQPEQIGLVHHFFEYPLAQSEPLQQTVTRDRVLACEVSRVRNRAPNGRTMLPTCHISFAQYTLARTTGQTQQATPAFPPKPEFTITANRLGRRMPSR